MVVAVGSINSDIPDTPVCNSFNVQENATKKLKHGFYADESLSKQDRIELSSVIQHSESFNDISHPGYISTIICHLCQTLC